MTNEEINALTDPQINVMMAVCLLNIIDYEVSESGKTIYSTEGRELYAITVKDCCNDPAVMMPIVIESKISFSFCRKQFAWFAADDAVKPKHSHFDTNPLRAAAIVYLKMKGVL